MWAFDDYIQIFEFLERRNSSDLRQPSRVEINQFCEVCGEKELVAQVEFVHQVDPPEMPFSGPVRLLAGTEVLEVTTGSTCIPNPFFNLALEISKKFGWTVITPHQVFESIDHLIASLRVSIDGTFFDCEMIEPNSEVVSMVESGHLANLHYRRHALAPLLDLEIRFQDHPFIRSQEKSNVARTFGVEVEITGGIEAENQFVSHLIQSALTDYEALLRPAAIGENSALC